MCYRYLSWKCSKKKKVSKLARVKLGQKSPKVSLPRSGILVDRGMLLLYQGDLLLGLMIMLATGEVHLAEMNDLFLHIFLLTTNSNDLKSLASNI